MNNPFDFFEKICCINLDRRPDRWKDCQDNFKKLGILERVERFPAMDYSTSENIPAGLRGKFGCTHSHLEIIRRAKHMMLKNILIFEDDIHLHRPADEIQKAVGAGTSELPDNWEMLYLSANPLDNPNSLNDFSPSLCQLNLAFTTHAFAVNHTAYDLILNDINTPDDLLNLISMILEKHVSIDGYLMAKVFPNQKSYIAKKLLFSQRNSFSDIDYDNRDLNNLLIENYSKQALLEA